MNDTKTVSGNIVHIEDGSEAPVLSLKVAITPKQSGTGTPSPDNVRQISGWESVNVTVSPTQDAQDGTTTTVNLGRTVYGGTLDVVTGVLTVTKVGVDLGSLTWSRYGDYTDKDRYITTGIDSTVKNDEANAICSIYPRLWGANGWWIGSGSGKLSVFTTYGQFSSVSAFKTAMSGQILCYPLATPQTYTLTPTEVKTLLGENNVWADAGPILEMTYRTEMLGIFGKIMIDGRPYFRPNNFELKREDVYASEYTTCTGKLIADKIGWKFSDLAMKWDILPDDDLLYLSTLTGTFDIIFRDSDGQHTETVIRKGFTNTPTRITGPDGTAIWTGVEMEVTFINVHNN